MTPPVQAQNFFENAWAFAPGAISAVLVLIAGWLLGGWLRRLVLNVLPSAYGFDNTVRPLMAQVVQYGTIIVALVIALGQIGIDTTSALAVLGAAGLAVALALQDTLKNLAAGIMLIWLRPIQAGEQIDADGITGTVVEIGLFVTQLRNHEGVHVFSPNKKIWDASIVNFSRGHSRRFDLTVTLPADTDIDAARRRLTDIAKREARVLTEPAPAVHVANVTPTSVDMVLRVWARTHDYWDVRVDLTDRAKRVFTELRVAEAPAPPAPQQPPPATDKARQEAGTTAAAAAAVTQRKSGQ